MKKIFLWLILSVLTVSQTACQNKVETKKPEKKSSENLQVAYFASGCFWCVEAIFESVKGVDEAVSGYSGGQTKNPGYETVSSGQTGHAETVAVYYDPKVVSYETLIKIFFGSHDPTTLNRQGPDRGTQYRSVIFYQTEKEKNVATSYVKSLEAKHVFNAPIVTQIVPFKIFYKAEDYHQDYEKYHSENPYIQNVSIPRLRKFQQKFPELLKGNVH
jgi:peptide-methionine (S)-S-oxide reductase